MFCPQCGEKNAEDIKFCRACGANISLVPMAINGTLPAPSSELLRDLSSLKHKSLEKAITSGAVGLAFVVIAFLIPYFMPAGNIWWFFMFIPAFAILGASLSEYLRYRSLKQQEEAATTVRRELPHTDPPLNLNPGDTTNAVPAHSVTESTTRRIHIDR